MIAPVARRLRRSYHQVRRRIGADRALPKRLVVRKATWLHDARSPVMLMIDDLTNAWHSHAGGPTWERGGDWGAGRNESGSAIRSLEEGLLQAFPEVRVTFFTVAGPISAYTHHQPFSYAAALDADDESRRFFRTLAADPRFELAYHGHDHGTPGDTSEQFIQEWRGFPSRESAVVQTQTGLATFNRAIGSVPAGGKYGGWDYNGYADAAVDASGFLWWCRDWMPRDVTGRVADEYYEPQFFGRNLVVALPSTVHGHYWDRKQIDRLLDCRQPITIEEHIAPSRPDGLVQTPNIIDDMDDLRRLYQYLRGKSVWHANGTDIASYVVARERSLVYDVTLDGFSVRYDGRVERPRLTVYVDCAGLCSPSNPSIEIMTPNGEQVPASACRFDRHRYRHMVTLPVSQGRYEVRPTANAAEADAVADKG